VHRYLCRTFANYILGVIILEGRDFVRWSDGTGTVALESAPFDSATVGIVVRWRAARGERIVGMVVQICGLEVYSFYAEGLQPAGSRGLPDQGKCGAGEP